MLSRIRKFSPRPRDYVITVRGSSSWGPRYHHNGLEIIWMAQRLSLQPRGYNYGPDITLKARRLPLWSMNYHHGPDIIIMTKRLSLWPGIMLQVSWKAVQGHCGLWRHAHSNLPWIWLPIEMVFYINIIKQETVHWIVNKPIQSHEIHFPIMLHFSYFTPIVDYLRKHIYTFSVKKKVCWQNISVSWHIFFPFSHALDGSDTYIIVSMFVTSD